MKKILLDKKLFYMFLVDIIAVVLLFICGFLIAETILPGIVAAYISPLSLFAALFILLRVATYWARYNTIDFSPSKKNYLVLCCNFIIFLTLVAIASFRFGFFYGAVTLVFASVIYFLITSILHDHLHTRQ